MIEKHGATLKLSAAIGAAVALCELAVSPAQRAAIQRGLGDLVTGTSHLAQSAFDTRQAEPVTPGTLALDPGKYEGKMVRLSGRIGAISDATFLVEGPKSAYDIKFVSLSPLEGASFQLTQISHFGPPNPIGAGTPNRDSAEINFWRSQEGSSIEVVGRFLSWGDGKFALAGMRVVSL
jgi:hypothetical protein